MNPAFALFRHTLLTNDRVLLWLFWLALLGLAALMTNRSSSILTAPLLVVLPTSLVGWQLGSRLWQLDREAMRGLMPSQNAALRRVVLLSVTIFALLPASLLWICGANFSLSIALLSAALLTSACLTLMPIFVTPLIVVFVLLTITASFESSLAGINGLGYTAIFALFAAAALLALLKRWRPLQSEQGGDVGLKTPFVLSTYEEGGSQIEEAELTMYNWWLWHGDNASPRHPERALAILLGKPLAPLAPLSVVAHLTGAVSAGTLVFATTSSKDLVTGVAGLLPTLVIISTLTFGMQCLTRMRHEWRHGSALFAEVRLLPGLKPDNGAWKRLLGMLLARLLGIAVLCSLLILASAWLRPNYTQVLALVLIPPWLALLCVVLFPAVIAGRGLYLVACAVLVGISLFAIAAAIMTWTGRLDALDPMLWLAYGIGLSVIATLSGLAGWLTGGRRHSPFIAR